MPDVFITLEEAATFESVKYNTLVQRMKRNPEQYRTQAQAQEGGGKDRTLPKNCLIRVNVFAFPTIFISGYFCASRMRLPE